MSSKVFKRIMYSFKSPWLVGAFLASLTLGGCLTETYHHGYVLAPDALEQIEIGSSRTQVDLVLGTPSTTGTVDGVKTYYYISQTREKLSFIKDDVTDQKVLAVYFDQDDSVTKIANYGLQNGRIFDFISRRTPTAGADTTFISRLLSATPGVAQ